MTTVLGNEHGFVEHYLKELSTRSVRYGQDYLSRSLPASSRIKRQPIKKVVEETKEETSNTIEQPITSADTIELTIKILKPSSQFRITRLNLDDSILGLKKRIYQQKAVPVKQQRLLLKGKVLSDDKSLNDYKITKDTTLHLMVSKPTTTTTTDESMDVDTSLSPPVSSSSNVLSGKAKDTLKSDSSIWKSIEDILHQHQLESNDIQLVLGKWKDSLSQ